MLRFSMTHTCSHLEHNHAPPPPPPTPRAFAFSWPGGGGGGECLAPRKSLKFRLKSPILRKFCLLKSLSPCLQKNVHLSKTGLCLPNTKIRSTFVNQKRIPPYLIYSTGSPYMQSPITTFFIFLTHNLTKRMRNE